MSVQSDQDVQSKATQDLHAVENPLLFINRYSKEPIDKRHGPNRTAVSVHVQRTIRKQKQHDAIMRLKSREFSKGLLKYRIAGIDVGKDFSRLHQGSTCPSHHSTQIPSRSDITKLQSAPEHNLVAQFDLQRYIGNSNPTGISQLVTFDTVAPLSDTLIRLPNLQWRSAEVAFAFCESASRLVTVNILLGGLSRFGQAHPH